MCKRARFTLTALLLVHGSGLIPGFFAPYGYDVQKRLMTFAPPTRIHFLDEQHRFHIRPFVCQWLPPPNASDAYTEDCRTIFPVRFLVSGAPYRIVNLLPSRLHLFGVDAPAQIFVAGTDAFGRDEFSRLLYGGQISLFAGLMAASISVAVGVALGCLAGFYGGWIDDAAMRAAEIFMTVPWLYLLLTIRAVLPLHIGQSWVFLLLFSALGIIGWARPARLIRGVVLSVKQRDYVLAARGFGAGDVYLVRRHILPFVTGVAATQMLLYIPQYILAEVTLSFFGLGVSEPDPSWGNMLAALQQPFVLQNCWWLFTPAALLTLVLIVYHWLFSQYATSSDQI